MRKLSILFLALVISLVAKSIKAETPIPLSHVEDKPKTYSYQLGNIKVTALQNSDILHDKSIFQYSNDQVLQEALQLPEATKAALNEFVIETEDKTILVDTGVDAATTLARLKEAGYEPENIDIILITHLHNDHIGGLLDENFGVVFSNPDVYIAQDELKANPDEYFVRAYGERIKPFTQNENILPNLKSVPAFGHTPGHTMYEINSQGKKMLIWGDLINSAVQFTYPDISTIYDTNQDEASQIRNNLLEQLSQEDTVVAGMHLVYPGMGVVVKEGEGWYKFVPLKAEPNKE